MSPWRMRLSGAWRVLRGKQIAYRTRLELRDGMIHVDTCFGEPLWFCENQITGTPRLGGDSE